MAEKITTLPIWKKNASTHERLYELAELAREKPELFQKWVIVYCEDNDKIFKIRMMEGQTTRTSDCFGILAAAQLQLWEDTKRG